MAERLGALDASFLCVEEQATPMHVGTVAVFRPGRTGFGYEDLVALVRSRLGLVPRFRQRVKSVPGRLAGPVWIDDTEFDVTYHVRRSALPRPGDVDQLCELVARLMSRPLDRARPLWELYLIEGLEGGRFALVSKTHLAMIDGVAAVDLAEVILSSTPAGAAADGPLTSWQPEPEPSGADLLLQAATELAQRPSRIVGSAREASKDVAASMSRLATTALSAAGTLAAVRRPGPQALKVTTGAHRRFAVAGVGLGEFRTVSRRLGGTVNDAILATLTLALRSWLLSRGEPLTATSTLRALVPVSVHDDDPAERATGTRVRAHSVDLPIGEANPVVCLQQVSFGMRVHADSGSGVDARSLVGLAGFAPPTLHSLGSRVAAGLSKRLYHTVVTNVPGPQRELYADDALLVAAYPVVPLMAGQALSTGLTSYAGRVYFGFTADRDAMADVAALVPALHEAQRQLLAAATSSKVSP